MKGTGSPNYSGKPPAKQKQPYRTSYEDKSTALEFVTARASPTTKAEKRREDRHLGQRERDTHTVV